MAAQVSTGEKKLCCKCGRIVTGQKRMRDSEGRYWCMACGQLDLKKKKLAEGGNCSGCGESFPSSKLSMLGSLPYCKGCLKQRRKDQTGSFLVNIREMFSGGSGETDKGKLIKMLSIVAVLAVIAALRWTGYF
jgi:hypothetical protein